MKSPRFEYYAPTSIPEAVALLSSCDNARVLAGGQSLMPMLNLRYVVPERVIDLNRVPDLDRIEERAEDISIGTMTRQRTIEKSDLLAREVPLLRKALRHVGHFQTRNRGTIGGSLSHLDPSAELPAVALTCDATIDIAGPAGQRSVPMQAFAQGYMQTDLAPTEILVRIRLPRRTGPVGTGFAEFARRHGDFAIAGACVLIACATDGSISLARVVLFGVADKPIRVAAAEACLTGAMVAAAPVDEAAKACGAIDAIEDRFYSAAYRARVAMAMARSAIAQACTEAAAAG